MDDEIGGLLREAIVNFGDESLRALVGAGPVTVTRLGEFLDGTQKLDLPRGRSREFIDNVMEVSCQLAATFPDDFLATFNHRRWMNSGDALAGLGYTRRPEAVPLLVAALKSDAHWSVRVDATRALAMFPQPESVAALLRAVDDTEYLVQYHAIESLGQVGDHDALERLSALASRPPGQAIADQATRAIMTLTRRLGDT